MLRNKVANSHKLLYEQDVDNGNLFSKLRILKKIQINDGLVNVPKWLVTLSSLLLTTLFTVLLASLLILTFAKRPATFQENCERRSCAPNLNLKCINNTCKCPDNQYYVTKCEKKKTYNEVCQANYQCLDNTNLYCIGGKCTCNETSYWKEISCKPRFSFQQPCNGDVCLDSLFLYCDKNTGICMCQDNR